MWSIGTALIIFVNVYNFVSINLSYIQYNTLKIVIDVIPSKKSPVYTDIDEWTFTWQLQEENIKMVKNSYRRDLPTAEIAAQLIGLMDTLIIDTRWDIIVL